MIAEPCAITLPDGRRLAYAEYGAAGGRPVMLFPGTPGSHVLASLASAPALARGVRIVAPDRPGVGRSDPQPGRRFGDWPADVARLADALGWERFAVIGVSGGGPFALACGARLRDRVSAVAVVGGAGNYLAPGAFDGMSLPLRLWWGFVRRAPGLARLLLLGTGGLTARYPDQALARLRRVLAPSDRAILSRADFGALFRRDVREAFLRGAGGAARDIELYASAWDFALVDIAATVYLWHGEADCVIPPAQARGVAAALPACVATFVPDAGHFWFVDHLDLVLDGMFKDAQ